MEGLLKLFLRSPQHRLRAFPLGNVTRIHDDAAGAIGIANGPPDSLEVPPRAVLVTKAKLGELGHPWASEKPLKCFGHHRQIFVVNKLKCTTPIELVLGVSKQSLDRRTFKSDDAVYIQNRNHIRGMLNKRTKMCFALLQGKIRLFAFSNVQGRSGHAKGLTAAISHDLTATVNGPHVAVRTDDSTFDIVGDGPHQCAIDRRQDTVMIIRKYRRYKAVESDRS